MNEHSGEQIGALATARLRRALAELDYRRALVSAVRSGLDVGEIGSYMGVSPEALEGVLGRSGQVGEVPEGFSGVRPLEVCQRYAVGEVSAESVAAQLSAWPYERGGPAVVEGRGSVAGSPRGQAWAQVGLAAEGGLIPIEIYEQVLGAVDPRLAGEVRSR